MSLNLGDLVHEDSKSSRWRQSITWSAVVVLGLLVYEFTTQPILGVIVICSKFGWNDFLIAYLLQRVDPNRGRSRAVFWFCLASGVLKVVFASMFLFMGLFLILGAPLGPGAFQAMLLRGISAFSVFLLGYLLITITVLRGAYYAEQTQTKVWLTTYWLLENSRNRHGSKTKQENLVDGLLALGMIPAWVLGFSLFPGLGSILEPQGLLLIIFIGFGLLWSGLLFLFLCKTFLRIKRRIVATNPYECWGCDALGQAMIAKISNGNRVRLLVQINRVQTQSDAEQSKP